MHTIVHPAPPNGEFWGTLVRSTNAWVSFLSGLKRTQVSAGAEKFERLSIDFPGRWLVDVTGIEPVTPCLQS